MVDRGLVLYCLHFLVSDSTGVSALAAELIRRAAGADYPT